MSTVFGDPVEREGITVIPVAKARFGFGGGGGAGGREGEEGSGGGGGGGALVNPVGYIELHDGAARFKRISSPPTCSPWSRRPRLRRSSLGDCWTDNRPARPAKRRTWAGVDSNHRPWD